MKDDGLPMFVRRDLMAIVIAGAAASAGPAEACTYLGPPARRDDVVRAFMSLCVARDYQGVERLLTDGFTFYPSPTSKPMDKKSFVAWLRAQPRAVPDRVTTEPIYARDRQAVQKEFVKFEDTPDRMAGSCGYSYNYSLRIAVYEVDGPPIGGSGTVQAPLPPHLMPPGSPKTPAPEREPFDGTKITELHHIDLPFSRED